ncbi:Gfo/Idh/MocA family protein [Wenzhouxiangella marina]|uniref:Gfo/Idh/MocA family protein n=1 Tax=Wenzhouxiangella marina TaxID=1579979 RepID=UPI0006733C13|nr:Gfo/Idh/MocA family oxidoreductase [Wenzhouxiangella marina]MBB6086733.1 putative dehydrogenase [Wenzhouxiangella marina]
MAIIGIGHVAAHQIRALENVEGVTLTAAHDRDSARATELPAGVQFFESLEALLTADMADLFLVSTPSDTHVEMARSVVAAGHGVVVEKPACLDRSELETLRALGDKAFVHVALHAAFAPELLWWRGNAETYELGPLYGFDCGFYDPYIRAGRLEDRATGLLGAWSDSGINALSAISRILSPEHLLLDTARMSRLPQIGCREIQGSALFSFDIDGIHGHGIIDTNWTLGLDQKTTRLWYHQGEALLHHSERRISLRTNGAWTIIKDFSSPAPRLEQHYEELFRDLLTSYKQGASNLDFALSLHDKFIAAMEKDVSTTRAKQ